MRKELAWCRRGHRWAPQRGTHSWDSEKILIPLTSLLSPPFSGLSLGGPSRKGEIEVEE